MPLNEMDVTALRCLTDDLIAVRIAMTHLEDCGLVALADLTPGRPMTITLVREMPEATRVIPPDPETSITAEDAPDLGQVQSAATPEPAVTDPGEADRPAAPGSQPEPVAGWPPAWTAEDIDRLIHLVADAMENEGLSLRAAALRAAPELGRPAEGTAYKARSLVERIEARRREIVAEMLPPGVTEAGQEIPAGPPAEQGQDAAAAGADEALSGKGPEGAEGATLPVDASAPVVAGAGAPLTPTGELQAHLARVPRDRVWTLERDRDLLHFFTLQWPANDIAMEIKVPAAEVKPRIAVLTASRKFKAADVLVELEIAFAKAQAA